MVNIEDISFPVTLEVFTALQVAEIRREPTATELELFQEVVDMANEAFEATVQGDTETVQALLDAINHVSPTDEYTRHVAALCRGWVFLGCRCGAVIFQLKEVYEMVNTENVSFPVTLEAFTALQVAEIQREPTATEMELFHDVVDMANEAFQAAAQGDAETVQVLLDSINSQPAEDEYIRHVAALCRGWVLLGCSRGMEILKAAIDGTTYS